MRIAQRTVSRNYKASLNRVLGKRADALRRSEDGLRFKDLSEDVAAGARAMNTQEMRYAAIQQKNTAEELLKELDAGWGVMGSMDSTIQDVLEEMKSAAGVRTEEKLAAIQKKIGNLKEEYLQQLNTQYGGKYLFGGTNNKSAPFTVNENDRLLFNGVEVSKIYKGQKVGLVGTAADDAKYAEDSRYYTDGVNYYHNDGLYYYDGNKQPPEFSADLSGFSADVKAATAGAATDVASKFLMGGQAIQIWDGVKWADANPITSNATGDFTMNGAQLTADLVTASGADGVKIGSDVYTVTDDGTGKLSFVWKGAAASNATLPTALDTSDAAKKAAGSPAGPLTVSITPGANAASVENIAGNDVGLDMATVPNTPVPYSSEIYLDTGLGLTVDRGAETAVDPRTAFQVNVIGLDLAGHTGFVNGIALDNGAYDQQTICNNIYDMISEVEKLLAPGYSEKQLDAMQMQLTKMNDTMRMSRTDVDTRANSLESMITRLKTEIDGMEKLEDSLMTADPANEAINLKDIEYSWQAVLALGSQILPSSLLDYLR